MFSNNHSNVCRGRTLLKMTGSVDEELTSKERRNKGVDKWNTFHTYQLTHRLVLFKERQGIGSRRVEEMMAGRQ